MYKKAQHGKERDIYIRIYSKAQNSQHWVLRLAFLSALPTLPVPYYYHYIATAKTLYTHYARRTFSPLLLSNILVNKHENSSAPGMSASDISVGEEAAGGNVLQLAQSLAAATRAVSVLPVHAVPLLLDARHVLVDVLNDLLGILGGQQALLHHLLDGVGLLGEDQRGGLFGADRSHRLRVDVLQPSARNRHLNKRNVTKKRDLSGFY